MKKLEKGLTAIVLTTTLCMTGVSFFQQSSAAQENNQTTTLRGGASQNGNGRRMNSNSGMMMNDNSGMMMNSNSSMMMNDNSSMMNSNMMMNSNSSMMSGGSMTGMIGNITVEEFQRQNQQGAAAVAAITPSSTALSKGDQKLMNEVAMGGMMQLEVSRAALTKVTSEGARVLAQSEVDEQTALGAKLREIATAKGMTMPEMSNPKAQKLIAKMNNLSGAELDRYYIRESGVKGHQTLDKTMTKVQSRADDENLKALANAALPLVRLHKQVSQDELGKMSGSNRSGDSMNGNSNNSNSNNR